jgi:predicted phage tail protein
MKTIYLHGPLGETVGREWQLNVKSPAEAIRAINVNTDGRFSDVLFRMVEQQALVGVIGLSKEKASRIQSAIDSEKYDESLLDDIFTKDDQLYFESNCQEIHFVPCVHGEFIVLPTLGVLATIPAIGGVFAGIATGLSATLTAVGLGGLTTMGFMGTGLGAAAATTATGAASTGLAVGSMGGVVGGSTAAAAGGFSLSQAAFYMAGSMLISGIANAMFPPVKTDDKTRKTKSYMFDDRPNMTRQGAPIPVGYGMLRIGSASLNFSKINRFIDVSKETIESFTNYSIQDIISEGPIEGFCDSYGNLMKNSGSGNDLDKNEFLKTIYLSDMKLMNDDGSLNFLPNEEGIPPRCSLGHEDSLVGQNGKATAPLRVEFVHGGQSPLQGPDSTIGGFLPLEAGMKASDYNGAKMFTYPISDRNVGIINMTLGSEAMFNNWTDKRVRRRLFSRRVEVTTGTSPMTINIGVRVYDGKKFIPPIMPIPSQFVLEDVETGKNKTSNYNLVGALHPHDRKPAQSFSSEERKKDLLRCFVYALFEDSELSSDGDFSSAPESIGQGSLVVGKEYKITIPGGYDFKSNHDAPDNNAETVFTALSTGNTGTEWRVEAVSSSPDGTGTVIRSRVLFKNISSAKDFVEKMFVIQSPTVEVDMYGTGEVKNFAYYLSKYMDELKRVDKSGKRLISIETGRAPSISRTAEVLGAIYSQLSLKPTSSSLGAEFVSNGLQQQTILHNNNSIIMDLIKNNSIDDNTTLGDDGYIYDLRIHAYEYIMKELNPDGTNNEFYHKSCPRTIQVEAYSHLPNRPEKFKLLDTTLKIAADLFPPWKGAYRSKGLIERNQAHIHIHGISTSPAMIDFNLQMPYLAFGESVNVQLLRLTKEITTPKEMQEKSTRMSLRGITKFKTIQGVPVKFKYPGTSWVSMEFDSVNFQQIPERNYLVKLKKVAVPRNYNSRTKKYLGAWDGVFKGQQNLGPDGDLKYSSISEDSLEWTDNPAWILLDILLNQRFGVGRSGMSLEHIDIWSLYSVAKFCDELVTTGFPLERPKRKFKTANISTRNQNAESYFTKSPEDLWNLSSYSSKGSVDSFEVEVLDNSDSPLSSDVFLDEYNNGLSPSTSQSSGRTVAFFMSDGTMERRMIRKISLREVSTVKHCVIEVYGPSFIDHSSTSGGSTVGSCVLELSHPIVEPRFSMNAYFTEAEEAYSVVQEITSAFRSITTYINGQISLSSENLKDPTLLFTDANVSPEGFTYAGTSKTSRLTAASVRYIDKYDNFKSKVAYFEDPGGIDKFGFKEEEVLGLGCTSKGQAQRMAKFIVLAPLLESEMISFSTGLEGAMLLPGAIIEVSDSRRFGENVNGRIKSVNVDAAEVQVDKIMTNLSFYDPETDLDIDRVELCVMVGRGFEDIGRMRGGNPAFPKARTGLYRKMADLASSPDNFDADDQLALVSGIRRGQLVYFDGFLSSNKRGIESLVEKHLFSVNTDSNLIYKENHGLKTGDKIKFISFGILPQVRGGWQLITTPIEVKTQADYIALADDDSGGATDHKELYKPAPPAHLHGGTRPSHYYIVADEKQRNTFSISSSADPLAPVEDFFNNGYALKDATITGGEHFYSVVSTVSGINPDAASLAKIAPGTVWSIRGYKRDIFGEAQGISEELEGFVTGIGARSIANSRAYYSEAFGRFHVASYDPVGKFITLSQLGDTGKGLGRIALSAVVDSSANDDRFFGGAYGGWVYLSDSLGWVWHLKDRGMFYKEETWFSRWKLNSDILSVVGHDSDDPITIGGKPFQVLKRNDYYFIKLNGDLPSYDEYPALWDDTSNAVGANTAPTTVTPTNFVVPQGSASIDINSFRHVGRRQYRINAVTEEEYGKYSIKASEYNRDKFEIIEKSLSLNRPTFPIPPQVPMDIPTAPVVVSIKDLTQRNV